jgi:hypothetical protein
VLYVSLNMNVAPNHILSATNQTISLACAHVRNITLSENHSSQQINQIMEAIHDIPTQLCDWHDDSLSKLRNHLASFDHSLWPGCPNFTLIFEQLLQEYGS